MGVEEKSRINIQKCSACGQNHNGLVMVKDVSDCPIAAKHLQGKCVCPSTKKDVYIFHSKDEEESAKESIGYLRAGIYCAIAAGVLVGACWLIGKTIDWIF
jgi:hypothetical protein